MMPPSMMVSAPEWLDLFLSNQFQYGSWAAHIAGYWPWRTRPNVLMLTYDQMLADPPGTVRRVAAFMGVALTEAELALVVEKSSFGYMKAIDRKFVPQPPPPIKTRQVMMRKGARGGSSELLTPAQQAQIDRFVQAELRRLQSDYPYADTFTVVDQAQPVATA
jgi:aryl sulfotransferase